MSSPYTSGTDPLIWLPLTLKMSMLGKLVRAPGSRLAGSSPLRVRRWQRGWIGRGQVGKLREDVWHDKWRGKECVRLHLQGRRTVWPAWRLATAQQGHTGRGCCGGVRIKADQTARAHLKSLTARLSSSRSRMTSKPGGTSPPRLLLASRTACRLSWRRISRLPGVVSLHTEGRPVSLLLRRSSVMSRGWVATALGMEPAPGVEPGRTRVLGFLSGLGAWEAYRVQAWMVHVREEAQGGGRSTHLQRAAGAGSAQGCRLWRGEGGGWVGQGQAYQ